MNLNNRRTGKDATKPRAWPRRIIQYQTQKLQDRIISVPMGTVSFTNPGISELLPTREYKYSEVRPGARGECASPVCIQQPLQQPHRDSNCQIKLKYMNVGMRSGGYCVTFGNYPLVQ